MTSSLPLRNLGVVALAAAQLLVAVSPLNAQEHTSEEAVRALESRRAEALLRADSDALSRMVADEFVEISRLGQLRTKQDNLRDIASGDLKLASVSYEDLTVRVYGDVAVLMGIANNTGTFRGIPFSGAIRYSRVFVRRDGRWQAVAMQHTPLTALPAVPSPARP